MQNIYTNFRELSGVIGDETAPRDTIASPGTHFTRRKLLFFVLCIFFFFLSQLIIVLWSEEDRRSVIRITPLRPLSKSLHDTKSNGRRKFPTFPSPSFYGLETRDQTFGDRHPARKGAFTTAMRTRASGITSDAEE